MAHSRTKSTGQALSGWAFCMFDQIAAALPKILDEFILLVLVGSGGNKYDRKKSVFYSEDEMSRRYSWRAIFQRASNSVLLSRAVKLSFENVSHVLLEFGPLRDHQDGPGTEFSVRRQTGNATSARVVELIV